MGSFSLLKFSFAPLEFFLLGRRLRSQEFRRAWLFTELSGCRVRSPVNRFTEPESVLEIILVENPDLVDAGMLELPPALLDKTAPTIGEYPDSMDCGMASHSRPVLNGRQRQFLGRVVPTYRLSK